MYILCRNKKNNVYPCKPQFYYIKWGFMGSKLYRHVFVMLYRIIPLHVMLRPQQIIEKKKQKTTTTTTTKKKQNKNNKKNNKKKKKKKKKKKQQESCCFLFVLFFCCCFFVLKIIKFMLVIQRWRSIEKRNLTSYFVQ